MIVIQTYRVVKATNQPIYKDYYATSGFEAELSIMQQDEDNNDLNIYGPIIIYNVFDTDEE